MKKLRVVQPRTRNEPTEFDLRGFGNDPLLNQSFPFAALSLGMRRADTVQSAGKKAGFDAEIDTATDSMILVPTHLREGDHKAQALRLFVLLLGRLSDLSPNARVRIFEVNRSRLQLVTAMKGSDRLTAAQAAKAANADLPEENGFLVVDAACGLHLKQAGFPLNVDGTASLSFTHSDLLTLRRAVVKEVAKTSGRGQKRSA